MTAWPQRFLTGMTALNGGVLLGTGLALAVVPQWFFTHVAPFSPFNRHFAGDAGIFSAGLGATLLLGAAQPQGRRSVIVIGTVTSFWHALNHLYDHAQTSDSLWHLLHHAQAWRDLSLLALGGLSLLALFLTRPRHKGQGGAGRVP